MKKMIVFLIFVTLNSSAMAEEYFSYSKIEGFSGKTKLTTGLIIKFENKVEIKTGLIYSLEVKTKGFMIESRIPIGKGGKHGRL